MKNEIVIKLSKEEVHILTNYLLEGLHAWSEKGVEIEEREEFEHLSNITIKFYEAIEEGQYIYII
jgi:hypothetical protein